MGEADAKFYISCVILALEFLEKEGYMTRMVNPSSIMVTGMGFPILSDLRYCKKMDGQRSFTVCGEQTYMAPEMITGEGYDFAVDSWGLGVLGYEMLVGSNPFGNSDVQETIVYKNIAAYKYGDFRSEIVKTRKDLSDACMNTIDMLLNTDPAKRLGGTGASTIKNSMWFSDNDWTKLRDQQVEPPHRALMYSLLHEKGQKEEDVKDFAQEIEDMGEVVTSFPLFEGF